MMRIRAGLCLGLVAGIFVAGSTSAAMNVALSVSPAEGVVGRPVEVLLRTFAPMGNGDSALPVPSFRYPAASGLWFVLYPYPDYPFDVVARSEGATSIAVQLLRDLSDATLWRGSFTPTETGQWTVAVRNFQSDTPGATASVAVAPSQAPPSIEIVGAFALVVGVLAGLLLGRFGVARRRVA